MTDAMASAAAQPDLESRFVELALANPVNTEVLRRLPELGVGDAWLVAGCLFQAVWNHRDGKAPGDSVNDYDVFYYDDRDLSWDAEDRVIRRGAALFDDLGVDVEIRNQARVHLWFEDRFGSPCAPLRNAHEGIERFVVAGTCVGLRMAPDGGHETRAPYGFDDMFNGVLRWNPLNPTPDRFEEKCESYRHRWPWLAIDRVPAKLPTV